MTTRMFEQNAEFTRMEEELASAALPDGEQSQQDESPRPAGGVQMGWQLSVHTLRGGYGLY